MFVWADSERALTDSIVVAGALSRAGGRFHASCSWLTTIAYTPGKVISGSALAIGERVTPRQQPEISTHIGDRPNVLTERNEVSVEAGNGKEKVLRRKPPPKKPVVQLNGDYRESANPIDIL
jgi:hypothetical protein